MHPEAPYIQRSGEVNAWDNPDFRAAVEATGKKQVIMAGIVTEVCTWSCCFRFCFNCSVNSSFTDYQVLPSSRYRCEKPATLSGQIPMQVEPLRPLLRRTQIDAWRKQEYMW